jgi:dTDP-4-amino-4,6-dideoxygalactose transaminase
MSSKQRVIGGMFGIEEMPSSGKHYIPSFMNQQSALLINARSGIFLLLELLSPRNIWVPSYLCSAILEAIDDRTTRIRFYEVDYNLALAPLDWLEDVDPGDVVILIDYFGFPQNRRDIARIKERGAWVLEDACQALLSGGVGDLSDFVLFSPRKFLGVPDGGILISNVECSLHDIDLNSPPSKWWLNALRAANLRSKFDAHGGSRRWFKLFKEVEAECPVGRYAMSEISKTILTSGFDWSAMVQQRVRNYEVLAAKLSRVAVFPNLFSNVVPLGFPIRVKNRTQVRQTLFDHEIYPPIHWPIEGLVPEKFRHSHHLASEIITLPCDQRYNSEDMERMAQLVLREVK